MELPHNRTSFVQTRARKFFQSGSEVYLALLSINRMMVEARTKKTYLIPLEELETSVGGKISKMQLFKIPCNNKTTAELRECGNIIKKDDGLIYIEFGVSSEETFDKNEELLYLHITVQHNQKPVEKTVAKKNKAGHRKPPKDEKEKDDEPEIKLEIV